MIKKSKTLLQNYIQTANNSLTFHQDNQDISHDCEGGAQD